MKRKIIYEKGDHQLEKRNDEVLGLNIIYYHTTPDPERSP